MVVPLPAIKSHRVPSGYITGHPGGAANATSLPHLSGVGATGHDVTQQTLLTLGVTLGPHRRRLHVKPADKQTSQSMQNSTAMDRRTTAFSCKTCQHIVHGQSLPNSTAMDRGTMSYV